MEDNDPFSFIVAKCKCSLGVQELFKRIPFARQELVFLGPELPVLRPHPPLSTPAAAVEVIDVDAIRVGDNRSPRIPTPVEKPSPNQRFRASTREVGESSRKRKAEIPEDVEIIMIEDSDDEEEVVVEDVGRQRGRLLPSWARGQVQNLTLETWLRRQARYPSNTQGTKQTGDNKITMMSVLHALAMKAMQARAHLCLDSDGTGSPFETALRRGVPFSVPKWWHEEDDDDQA